VKIGARSNASVRLWLLGCIAALALAFAGCGGSSAPSPAPQNPIPRITSISPQTALAGTRALTLIVTGSNFISSSVVRWDGSNLTTAYSSNSILTATVPPEDLSGVGAKSIEVFNPAPGGGTSNSASFQVTTPPPLSILTTSLPAAHHSREYDYTLQATGGIPPYSWSITGGSLPNGLNLDDGGKISGTPPTVAENTLSDFEVQVSDDAFQPNALTQTLDILVRAASLGRNETCGTASPVSNGVLNASISPLGDIDVYSFQGTAGSVVEIETYAQRIKVGGDPNNVVANADAFIDTYLELLDSGCNRLIYNDDISFGISMDSLISGYVLPYTGTYYIRVSDLRGDGRPDFGYELDLSGAD